MSKDTEAVRGLRIKSRIREVLKSGKTDLIARMLADLPGRKIITPLLSCLLSTDQKMKWSAVYAVGIVVANIAEEDMESARVIIRRLMWNLNDESGGIGWGSAEAMGEILSRHQGLAEEYSHILISYARKDGNYLEHPILQRGLLWGISRLVQTRPDLVRDSSDYFMHYLGSDDAVVRGLASWLMGMLGVSQAVDLLDTLRDDDSEMEVYLNIEPHRCRVMDIAGKALALIKQKGEGNVIN